MNNVWQRHCGRNIVVEKEALIELLKRDVHRYSALFAGRPALRGRAGGDSEKSGEKAGASGGHFGIRSSRRRGRFWTMRSCIPSALALNQNFSGAGGPAGGTLWKVLSSLEHWCYFRLLFPHSQSWSKTFTRE